MTAKEFNRVAREIGKVAEEFESALVVVYEKALREAARFYSRQFARTSIVASPTDQWQAMAWLLERRSPPDTKIEPLVVRGPSELHAVFGLRAAGDWVPPAGEPTFDSQSALAAATEQREIAALAIEEVITARVSNIAISWDAESFRVFSPDLLESLGQHAGANFDAKMSDTLASTIRESFDKGLSVPDTAKAITGRIDGVGRSTATMLARTDLISLANGGAFMAAQQVFAEGEVSKKWINTHDARTRPSHATAGGQTVPLENAFTVGGFSLMYPGDPQGPPGEVINCRCTFVTVQVSEESRLAHEPRQDMSLFGVEKGETARSLLGNFQDTEAMFRPGGTWTEARRIGVHQPIVAEPLNGVRPVPAGQQPRTLFLAGGSGVGKSTVKAKLTRSKQGDVDIDPDAMKERLREYQEMVKTFDPYAAIGVHEETSWLAKQALIAANERRMNVIVDGTGDGGPGDFVRKIDKQISLGNKVEVVLIDAPVDTAIDRVHKRAVRSGRAIADDVVRDIHRKVSASFPDYRSKVDWQIWSNDAGKGGERLVARRVDGVEEIIDAERFEQFLAKAEA